VGVAPVTAPDPWSNLLWPRSLEDAGWTWDQLCNTKSDVLLTWVLTGHLSLKPMRERKLASRGGGWAQSSQAEKKNKMLTIEFK
jgi:hypothetical protein